MSTPDTVQSDFANAAGRPTLASRFSSTDATMGLVGSVLLPLGLMVVLLGWYGASHTPYLFEQLPYLISGGLFGLGLVLVGGMVLFGSWVARTAREQRAASTELLTVMREIRNELHGLQDLTAPAATPRQRAGRSSNGSNGHAPGLVATANGSMLHRPDCAVVVNREDLHAVTAREEKAMQPCRLCDPLGASEGARL